MSAKLVVSQLLESDGLRNYADAAVASDMKLWATRPYRRSFEWKKSPQRQDITEVSILYNLLDDSVEFGVDADGYDNLNISFDVSDKDYPDVSRRLYQVVQRLQSAIDVWEHEVTDRIDGSYVITLMRMFAVDAGLIQY